MSSTEPFCTKENEVRPSDNRLVVPPTDDPVPAQDLHETQFGLLIARDTNLGHHARTRSRRKDVSHWNQLSIHLEVPCHTPPTQLQEVPRAGWLRPHNSQAIVR
jgi:hypothetical protein